MKNIVLEQLHIPTPCPQFWENMHGSPQRRFCTTCNKHVYNLIEFSRGEVEKLLQSCGSGGHACVRVLRDGNNHVLTTEDFVFPRVRALLTRGGLHRLSRFLLLLAPLFLLIGCRRMDMPTGNVSTGTPMPPSISSTKLGEVSVALPLLSSGPPTTTPSIGPSEITGDVVLPTQWRGY